MTNLNQHRTGTRSIARSALALFAGFIATVVLSLVTDLGLHDLGVMPSPGQPMSDALLLIATAYRTIYGTIGAFVVARLAPSRPLQHALIGGAIGTALSALGLVVTWNQDLGPHWYPVALVLLALPSAWVGGKFAIAQIANRPRP